MMLVVPLRPLASQVVNPTLNGQNCRIAVYQKSTGMFLDLTVGGVPIVAGVQCRNLRRMVIDAYRGFIGDIGFYDTQARDDPDWTGLGKRFVLLYQSPDQAAAIVASSSAPASSQPSTLTPSLSLSAGSFPSSGDPAADGIPIDSPYLNGDFLCIRTK